MGSVGVAGAGGFYGKAAARRSGAAADRSADFVTEPGHVFSAVIADAAGGV